MMVSTPKSVAPLPSRTSRMACVWSGLVISAALLAGCEKSTSDRDITKISVSDTKKLLAEGRKGGNERRVLLLDPRAPQDYAAEHIPGAANVRLNETPQGSAPERRLAQYETLVVYGDNPGSASASAMVKRLLAIGYGSVKLLVGGLDQWKLEGGEVAAAPATK